MLKLYRGMLSDTKSFPVTMFVQLTKGNGVTQSPMPSGSYDLGVRLHASSWFRASPVPTGERSMWRVSHRTWKQNVTVTDAASASPCHRMSTTWSTQGMGAKRERGTNYSILFQKLRSQPLLLLPPRVHCKLSLKYMKIFSWIRTRLTQMTS